MRNWGRLIRSKWILNLFKKQMKSIFNQLNSPLWLGRKWFNPQPSFCLPRFRCATLDRSDQTIWVAHRWRGATQITWSGKRLSRTMVCTTVALRSDQRAKSGKWSGQWSHDGLIRGQSLENGLDNDRTTVWSEGKVWEVLWTMVALRSDQRPKSGHKLPQNLTIFIWLQFYYHCFWWLKIKISCISKCLFVYIFTI